LNVRGEGLNVQSVKLEAYNLSGIDCPGAVFYANVWVTHPWERRGTPGSVGEHDSVPINYGPYHASPGVPMIVDAGLQGDYEQNDEVCAQFYAQLPSNARGKRAYGYGGTDLGHPLTDVVCARIHR
jgi:hypothetical protein